MNSAKNTDRASKSGGGTGSLTASTALLYRRLGVSPTSRMLTPYEIGLLRRSKKEMAEVVGEVLADNNIITKTAIPNGSDTTTSPVDTGK